MSSSVVRWNYSLFNPSLKKYKTIALFILITNWASVLATTSVPANGVSNDNFIRCTQVPFLTIHENSQEGNDPQSLSSKINSIVENEQGQVKKSHNSTVVTVSCQSSQPITWQYNAPKAGNLHKIIKSVKVSRSALAPWNRTTFCYQANITLEVPPGVYTGWYTCLVIPEENEDHSSHLTHQENIPVAKGAQTSVYLYRNEKSNIPLMVRNPIVTFTPMEFSDILLPSLWKAPNATRKYSKLDIQSSEFLSIDEEASGFDNGRRTNLTMPDPILGTYKYPLNESEVIFQVTGLLHEKAERSNDIFVRFNGQESCDNVTSFTFTCESRSGTQPRLRLQVLVCENPIHCDLLWETSPQYFREVVSGNGNHTKRCPSGQSGVVICGSEDGMTYQYAHYFVKEDNQILVINDTEPLAGLDTISMEIDIFNWEPEYYCVNNTIEIFCKANQYLFTPDFQLIVGYKNGSLGSTVGMVLNSSETVHMGYHHYHWKLNVTSIDITSYACLAPLIRSREWMNETKIVKVLYPVPPTILMNDPRTSTSTVAFYDTDVDRVLSCAATGVPSPHIEWLKNNNEFSLMYKTIYKRNHKNQKHGDRLLTVSSLHIPKMKDLGADLPGNWSCRASNGYHPDASYSIDVKVTVRKSWWIWVANGVFICAAIMTGLYIRQIYKKKKVMRKLEEILNELINNILRGDTERISKAKSLLKTLRGAAGNGPHAHAASDGTDEDFIGREVIPAIPFPPAMLLEPTNLSGDTNQKLGFGFYGNVYKGNYIYSNGVSIQVAIKTPNITEDWSETIRNRKAVLEELRLIAYIPEHEYVVRFIGGVILQNTPESNDNGRIQVVLELCETSLQDYLFTYGCYYVDETVANNPEICDDPYKKFAPKVIKTSDLNRWSFQIACGMQHLAFLKILHRDLAARNVLLVTNNGQLDVRITDFGLSKKLPERHVSYETKSTWKLLPWRYHAPELFSTPQKFSQATDVWAFGITMWEIFTLAEKDPYHEYPRDTDEFRNAIQNLDLRNPKPKHAGTAIYEIMQACWESEPTHRPTFTELIQIFQDKDLLPKDYLATIPTSAYELPAESYVYDYIESLLPETEQSNVEENQSWSKWFSQLCRRLCKL